MAAAPEAEAEAEPRSRDNEVMSVFLAASIVLASVVLAASVLTTGSDPATASETTASSAAPVRLFAEPNVLTFARPISDIVLSVTARPGGPIDLMPLTSEASPPLTLSNVRAALGGKPVELTRCGESCLRIDRSVLTGQRALLEVTMPRAGEPAADAFIRLPARLPAAGDTLFRTVGKTMGQLETVRYTETLRASDGTAAVSRYQVRAPDRVRIDVASGAALVIVGDRRWARSAASAPWVQSEVEATRVPQYPWAGAERPRILGRARVGGVPVRILGLVSTQGPAPSWFRLFVAADGRVLQLEMLGAGHVMTHRYSGFNVPIEIEPPA